jgi:alcohol dehydrogenase
MIAVHIEKGQVRIKHIRVPRRREGFALIRLLAGGICNTDLELQHGYYGFSGTPGHEFVGEVIEADDRALIGKRVVGEINLACGRCSWCEKGVGRHCPYRTVLGIVKHPGAFREFLTLPERNLHVLPTRLKTEEAVFVEPLAAACELLDQVKIPKNSQVAVLGDGKLGLLVAQVLSSAKLGVHHYGRHPDKLRISSRRGIQTKVVQTKVPAASYDYVVDATGSDKGLRQAVQMTRPRGTVMMKSTLHGTVALDTAPIIVNEITLIGSRCGRFEPAIQLLESGRVQVKEMISDEFELADAAKAFRRAAQRGVLKVLLRN